MNKLIILYTLFNFIFLSTINAQSINKNNINDSILASKSDSIYIKKTLKNPIKASLYSAFLPGLGQLYNGKKIKAPIVLGIVGTGLGFCIYLENNYNKLKKAYISSLNGWEHEFSNIPNLTVESLARAQDRAKRNRDYAIAITSLLYILNIIEATVDAHLSDFKIDKDLAIKPVIINNPINLNNNLGLSINLSF